MLSIKVLDRDDKTIAVSRGEEEVNLVCAREYREGDRIILEVDGEDICGSRQMMHLASPWYM